MKITRIFSLLNGFIHEHPNITQFLIEESKKLEEGDQIKISFINDNKEGTLTVTKSDIELFELLRSFAK